MPQPLKENADTKKKPIVRRAMRKMYKRMFIKKNAGVDNGGKHKNDAPKDLMTPRQDRVPPQNIASQEELGNNLTVATIRNESDKKPHSKESSTNAPEHISVSKKRGDDHGSKQLGKNLSPEKDNSKPSMTEVSNDVRVKTGSPSKRDVAQSNKNARAVNPKSARSVAKKSITLALLLFVPNAFYNTGLIMASFCKLIASKIFDVSVGFLSYMGKSAYITAEVLALCAIKPLESIMITKSKAPKGQDASKNISESKVVGESVRLGR